MDYPFRLCGSTIQIFRFKSTNQGAEGGVDPIIGYFPTIDEAEAFGGDVDPMDTSDYEWIDGIKAESADEAIEIYQLGKGGWIASKILAKCAELSESCHAVIVAGVDVILSDGAVSHFGLAETDQINLTTALAVVEQGAEAYPYHADGQLCRMYPAEDIVNIAKAATAHKLYHTTYCNHLLAWAKRTESVADLQAITYGAELPEDLASNMAEVLNHAAAG